MKLNDRIRKLEKKMDVPDFEHGSTKIAWECLTRQERLLFSKIQEIQGKYGDEPPADVQNENMDLYRMAVKIIWLRTFDLFHTVIDGLFLKGDKLSWFVFWSRFTAFFDTTIEIVKMLQIEQDFYKKFEEQYGEDWPDILQEKYGDNWPEPDYSSVGEWDFEEALKNQITLGFETGKKE